MVRPVNVHFKTFTKMAFTASALQEAQYRLSEMFASPNISQTESLKGSAIAAAAMLRRQTGRTVERMNGKTCVGWEGWFFRPLAEAHADVTAPETCDIPTGNDGSTIKKDFVNAVLARTAATLDTNRCDNLLNTVEEMQAQIRQMMVELRFRLNRGVIIPGLTAAAQTNLDDFIPSTWDDAADAPRILAPETDFTFENLNEFDIVAQNNNFADYFWISGRLFNDNKWMAMLNSGNETLRNQALAWAQQEIFFDVRDVDQTMTKKTAFAVDANSYLFWNYSVYTPTAVEIYDRHWVWAQPDPFLMWNNNGRLTPVLYEFEMKETCASRDSLEHHQSTIELYARLLGGFEFAPDGVNGESGVLEFGVEAI